MIVQYNASHMESYRKEGKDSSELINDMKKIVVLTGAGMSAESGLKTFRDSDGLWENHNVYDVATPEAWERDPEMVLWDVIEGKVFIR